MEDGDPVRHRDELVQVLGDERGRRPRRRAARGSARAPAGSTRRRGRGSGREQVHGRLGRERLGEDDALDVPAGERPDVAVGVRHLQLGRPVEVDAGVAQAAPVDAEPAPARAAHALQRGRGRCARGRSCRAPPTGGPDPPEPRRRRRRARPAESARRSSFPATAIAPSRQCSAPATASASSRWPLPATPAMPTTSPPSTCRSSERSPARPPVPDTLRPRISRTRRGLRRLHPLGRQRRHAHADHRLDELAVVHRVGRDALEDAAPAAQDREAVCHLARLAELVRDHQDREAAAAELVHLREEPVRLLGREHARRLVEDEDPGAGDEHLRDLDLLLLRDRERAQRRVEVDREPDRLGDLGEPRGELAAAQQRARIRRRRAPRSRAR